MATVEPIKAPSSRAASRRAEVTIGIVIYYTPLCIFQDWVYRYRTAYYSRPLLTKRD
jgi:hypothetical protein